jgi:hypothetical protein
MVPMPLERLTDIVRALLRRPTRGDGFAVRLDWPGYGPVLVCHDLTQFTPSLERALQRVVSTERYWARGPLRPLAVTVVPIDYPTYLAHPRECSSVGCPTTAALLGLEAHTVLTAQDREGGAALG